MMRGSAFVTSSLVAARCVAAAAARHLNGFSLEQASIYPAEDIRRGGPPRDGRALKRDSLANPRRRDRREEHFALANPPYLNEAHWPAWAADHPGVRS